MGGDEGCVCVNFEKVSGKQKSYLGPLELFWEFQVELTITRRSRWNTERGVQKE